MTRVALVGASGFVGSAVRSALELYGVDVVPISAPRLSTTARSCGELAAELAAPAIQELVSGLRGRMSDCDVVVNAAGVAQSSGGGDKMFGANALLPGVLALAVRASARFIHISSAAVQGRRKMLDQSDARTPFSPYSESKALGEELLGIAGPKVVIYRPTSVHGVDRPVTQSLIKALRSPVASVAAGSRPTPQVLVGNVGDAVAFLALYEYRLPPVVLHPWEGLTTRDLYRVLNGRRPVVIPMPIARTLIAVAYLVARWSSTAAATVRRIEMLWLGQGQGPSWLDDRWVPPLGRDAWKDLA